VSATVFAVEDHTAQVVVATRAGVHAHDVHGLDAGATQTIEVAGHQLSVSTVAAPPGRLLSKVATLSDLHLGASHHFGVREPDDVDVPFPLRCSRAAVREALAWGAEAIVFKGDLTQHGRPDEIAQFSELLDGIDVPVGLLLGNHDLRAADHGAGVRKALADIGRPFEDVTTLDVPGARLLLVDTTVPGREIGRLRHIHAHAVTCAADAPGPVVVMLHHHLQPWRVPTAYPLGVPSGDAGRFLHDLHAANRALFVTSGHSHRHHARTRHGVPITQVGSVKDYPGVWAGYAIHEGGIRQVVRRIAEPDSLAWTQRTAAAVGGIWGRWTEGRLAHRCLTHAWPPTPSNW
jgi:3',5'-cyclic AMP phosphodiesterase CpdA